MNAIKHMNTSDDVIKNVSPVSNAMSYTITQAGNYRQCLSEQ